MKKGIALLLAVVMLWSLAACTAKSAEDVTADIEEPTVLEPIPAEAHPDAPSLPLTAEQTGAMSTFMNDGMYAFDGNRLFGLMQTEENKKDNFGSLSVGIKSGFPSFDAPAIFAENCIPKYLCMNPQYLFFTNDGAGLYRIDRETKEMTCIYEHPCAFVQVVGDRLFFTNEDELFVSTDFDGGDLKLIMTRAVRYPYVLSDCIIYQDVADGESLYLYNADGSGVKLNDEPSFLPTILESTVYYTTTVEGGQYALHRIDLNGENHTIESNDYAMNKYFCLDGTDIYAVNSYCWPMAEWKSVGDDSLTTSLRSRTYYVSPEYTITFDYMQDGSVEYKWLLSNQTTGGSFF